MKFNNSNENISAADEVVKNAKKGDIDDFIYYDQLSKQCSEK